MDFPLFQLAVERVGTEDTGKGFLCDARITGAMLYGSMGCAAGQPSMGRVTTLPVVTGSYRDVQFVDQMKSVIAFIGDEIFQCRLGPIWTTHP